MKSARRYVVSAEGVICNELCGEYGSSHHSLPATCRLSPTNATYPMRRRSATHRHHRWMIRIAHPCSTIRQRRPRHRLTTRSQTSSTPSPTSLCAHARSAMSGSKPARAHLEPICSCVNFSFVGVVGCVPSQLKISDCGWGAARNECATLAFQCTTYLRMSTLLIPQLPLLPTSGSNRCLKRNRPAWGTQHGSAFSAAEEQDKRSRGQADATAAEAGDEDAIPSTSVSIGFVKIMMCEECMRMTKCAQLKEQMHQFILYSGCVS